MSNVKHFEAVQLFHKSKERVVLVVEKGVGKKDDDEDDERPPYPPDNSVMNPSFFEMSIL